MPTTESDLLPFAIANDLLATPTALRQQAANDGYLYFKRLLDPKRLEALRQDILAIIARRGWLDPSRPIEDGIAGAKPYVESLDQEHSEAYGEIQLLESFHALAHEPKLLGALTALFGEQILVHPRNIARLIFPNNTLFTTPAHQDYFHIMGTPDTWTSWIPLMDCPRALGGLAILPRTHLLGPLPVRAAYGAGGVGIDTDHVPESWRSNDFACGDLVIFHSLTVHRGLDNVDPERRMRFSVDFRYQAASKPVVFHSLEPHHTMGLTWEKIYRGWQSATYQYYWRKLELNVVDEDRSNPNLIRPQDARPQDAAASKHTSR
jgi:ectoine hydroxylase-related dioxygenase (phytanoyl-CoA dioxygenase family)